MRLYHVPITWEMIGGIVVSAEDEEEAIHLADRRLTNDPLILEKLRLTGETVIDSEKVEVELIEQYSEFDSVY